MTSTDIPFHLQDHQTFLKFHPMSHHMACVALRVLLGLYTLKKGTEFVATWVGPPALIIFITMFWTKPLSWKVYARTIVVYLIVSFADIPKDVAGTLIIVDALMGLQSRHTASLFALNPGTKA